METAVQFRENSEGRLRGSGEWGGEPGVERQVLCGLNHLAPCSTTPC